MFGLSLNNDINKTNFQGKVDSEHENASQRTNGRGMDYSLRSRSADDGGKVEQKCRKRKHC